MGAIEVLEIVTPCDDRDDAERRNCGSLLRGVHVGPILFGVCAPSFTVLSSPSQETV